MKKTGKPGVYIIKNNINNKVYIGASKDTYNRLCMHKVGLRRGNHVNRHLQDSYNLYGEDKFTFHVLEECDVSMIYSREHRWCEVFNSHNREFGYNIDPTSEIGKTAVSEETRMKMCAGAEKRPVFVYTIYGQFVTKFTDLYKCGEYFNTAPANIHRKMNVLFNKKNLIDSPITKYIVADEATSLKDIVRFWEDIFSEINKCKGPYIVHDCFGNYRGNATSRQLVNILGVSINSISTSVRRGTYLKTLKITKCLL